MIVMPLLAGRPWRLTTGCLLHLRSTDGRLLLGGADRLNE